jgi:hypothetical protein
MCDTISVPLHVCQLYCLDLCTGATGVYMCGVAYAYCSGQSLLFFAMTPMVASAALQQLITLSRRMGDRSSRGFAEVTVSDFGFIVPAFWDSVDVGRGQCKVHACSQACAACSRQTKSAAPAVRLVRQDMSHCAAFSK